MSIDFVPIFHIYRALVPHDLLIRLISRGNMDCGIPVFEVILYVTKFHGVEHEGGGCSDRTRGEGDCACCRACA